MATPPTPQRQIRARRISTTSVDTNKPHLGNNGTVVRVDGIDGRGLTVTNEATGATGLIAFDTRDSGRLRMAPGWVSIIHTAQGSTVENAMLVLPSGSQSVDLLSLDELHQIGSSACFQNAGRAMLTACISRSVTLRPLG